MGLIGFLRKLFGGKHKAKHKKHRHKTKHHKTQKTKKLKHKTTHKALKKNKRKTKTHKHSIKHEQKLKVLKHKQASEAKANAKKPEYGIPKNHKHEAKIKVAEKRSEIEEFYTKPKGKVALKIMERGSPEFEETTKDDHTFDFKEDKNLSEKEKTSIKKMEEIAKISRSSELVTTKLDTILNIVNKTGKVRIDQLSQALKIHEKKIEELANILAKNNQIDIHYPLIGKPELKKKKEAKNV